MALTLELLDHMATHHPEEIALTEQEHAISFMQLKQLVDTLGQELFGHAPHIYGQHTENHTSRQILALCADRMGLHSLVNIPTSISKEGLSATLKAAHLQVLYTDLMDKLWETANVFGPFISRVTPIELCHRRVWKIKFRSDQSGKKIDEEEVKFYYRQAHANQPSVPHAQKKDMTA